MTNALLYFSGCLFYALDQWIEEGGGIVFVTSEHWRIPHAEHISRQSIVTQFKPPSKLRAPWYSLFGFYGYVAPGDIEKRLPPTFSGMLLGTILLFPVGAVWVLSRGVGRLLRPIP